MCLDRAHPCEWYGPGTSGRRTVRPGAEAAVPGSLAVPTQRRMEGRHHPRYRTAPAIAHQHAAKSARRMLRRLRLIYFTRADTKDAGFIETEHSGVRHHDRDSAIDLSGIAQRDCVEPSGQGWGGRRRRRGAARSLHCGRARRRGPWTSPWSAAREFRECGRTLAANPRAGRGFAGLSERVLEATAVLPGRPGRDWAGGSRGRWPGAYADGGVRPGGRT